MTALRVLHVDDEPDIREVVELSLGFDSELTTRSCGTGQEALSVAAEWPPDIILLDVMMPVMDGPTTLTQLRANEKTAGIPVVFMTARAQTRELDHLKSLGAAGVLPKPFDPLTLAATVRSYAQPVNRGLSKLRSSFLQRVNDDAAILKSYQGVLKNRTVTPAALAAIRHTAHNLAGAGGIYGFSEIGSAAAELEEAVIFQLNGSASIERVAGTLEALLVCIEKNEAFGKKPIDSVADA